MVLEDNIKSAEVEVKVIGKHEGTKGLIFKRPSFLVALEIIDDAFISGDKTHTLPMSFDQYCQLNVGDTYLLTMYTPDEETWYFHREHAELFS